MAKNKKTNPGYICCLDLITTLPKLPAKIITNTMNSILAENENEGFIANQITRNDGFFKTVAPLQSPAIGQTGNFIFALNTTIDFPIKYVPLKLFFDIGFTQDNIVNANTPPALKQFAYEGGFMFSFFDEGFEIYFPLFYNKEFRTYYKLERAKIWTAHFLSVTCYTNWNYTKKFVI